MDVDPVASMRCWAIDLELGGHLFTIPALPAADWWPVLTTGDLSLILDFIPPDPDDLFSLDDMILDHPATLGEALTDAVEVVAGRTLHAAMVLAGVATMHWPGINGTITAHGFRWDDRPLGAALDAIYAEVTSRLDKAELAKFLALLDNDTMPGRKRGGRVSGKAAQDFEAVAGPRPTTGVKSTSGLSGNARPRTRLRPPPHPPAAPSALPTTQPGPPAGSDHPATTGNPAGGAPRASGTGLPPPPPGH